jgi:hypothetical protein
MELIIQMYRYSDLTNPKMVQRQAEIDGCLRLNTANPVIRRIHVFAKAADHDYFRAISPAAVFVDSESQPTYKAMIDYANTLAEGTVVTIANSDMEIGPIEPRILGLVNAKTMLAITRYEKGGSKPQIDKYGGSHDVFTFMTPLRLDTGRVNHRQNMWGAETCLLYWIRLGGGYTILNPCTQYITYHHHEGATYFEDYTRVDNDARYMCPPCVVKF